MTENPLISVIIPTYNRGRLILDSVNSVLNQTYKNIELIVVDDCSTDDTLKVLSEIKDVRLKVLKHDVNKGQNAARCTGIFAATGELMAHHDSDDVWHLDKLEKQIEFMKNTNADVVCSQTAVYNEDSNGFMYNHPDLNRVKEGQITYENLLIYNCTTTQTFFGKSECFKECPFDPNQPRFTDWALALQLVQKYKMFFQAEVLADVFQQKDSITRNPQKGLKAMEKLYNEHKEAIDSNSKVKAAFFTKWAGPVWRSGQNPVKELAIVYECQPTAKNLLKLILAKLHLFRFFGKLKENF